MEKATVVKNLLQSEWNSSNTLGRTPTIGVIYDYKMIDIRLKDWVLVYEAGVAHNFAGIGGREFDVQARVSIDTRTSNSEMHEKMRAEIERIIRNNISHSGYLIIGIVDERDLSDKMKGLYRYVIDVELRKIDSI